MNAAVNKLRWRKKGLLFEPPTNLAWLSTHAVLPFAERIEGDLFKVYFCGRDKMNRSQIGYFEFNVSAPDKILYLHDNALLEVGPLGAYDDSGVTSSWVVNVDERKYHYYTGWSLGVTIPFYFYVGLAVSDPQNQKPHKISLAPLLERDEVDPFLTASPCVLIDNGLWRMWYVSCVRWELERGEPKHYYHIKYAESKDGVHWRRTGQVCIDFKSPGEYAIARPSVIKEQGIYKMWYSYRGDSYRIGYAESADGLNWERKDEEVGLDVSASGWDSEMIEYPHVFDHDGKRYMLYNGNGYGKTGIGLAVLGEASG